MNDTQLTTLAMSIELGVPAVLAALLFVAPKLRPMIYSILGAVTPFLFAYFSTYMAARAGSDPDAEFALAAIWSMSLFSYCVALLVGMLLGLLTKPTHSAMRYTVAAVAAIGVVTAVLLLQSFVAR